MESPESDKLSDFPKQLSMGDGFSLKLTYSFDPGGDADGVSVLIPVELLDHVSPELFEWLVPGLLSEKVLFLLKGLPKNIRKQLIPIQQTADDVTKKLTIYRGSLYKQLEEQIRQLHRVRISRSQWPQEQIPPHLKIRYILQDGSGRTLITTRNFSELKVDKGREQESGTLNQLRKKWERSNITTWDFAELPEKIPLQSKKNKLLGFAYPCLHKDEQGNLSIRLLSDSAESRRISREGILELYSLQFPKQFKLLKKDCTLPSSLWALYEGLGSRQQLSEYVYHFVLDQIFGSKNSLWPQKDEFLKLVESVKKEGLFNRARKLTELVLDLLKERRETIDQINRLKSMTQTKSRTAFKVNSFKEELTEIVPADFLQQFDTEQMSSAIRYCKALQIRMERAYASPDKDQIKAEQILPFISRFKELNPREPSPECLRLFEEYRNMLAEYKISVFAQEMKTRFPVSAKRLDKKWKEIMNSC